MEQPSAISWLRLTASSLAGKEAVHLLRRPDVELIDELVHAGSP